MAINIENRNRLHTGKWKPKKAIYAFEYVRSTLYRYTHKSRNPATGEQILRLARLISAKRVLLDDLFKQPKRYRRLNKATAERMINKLEKARPNEILF